MKTNLTLIGFMGSGKSTIAHKLKKELEMTVVDVDDLIEKNEKRSIRSIFEEHGEGVFRDIETKTVISLENYKNTIISTGGGVIVRDENIESLKKHSKIIYLNVDREELYKRLINSKNRPLLDGENLMNIINQKMDERQELYIKSADEVLDIKNETVLDIVNLIKKIYIEND